MFENTITYGSLIGVFCLAYSMNVAIETLRISNSDHGRFFGPRIAHSGIASGRRDGVTTAERDRIKALERENCQLRQANEILKKASAYFAQAELDRPFRK